MIMILALVLAFIAILTTSLLKTYRRVSERELKRRARTGDHLAAGLYRAVAYGPSLHAVLWFLVGVSHAVFFVNVSRQSSVWLATIVVALVIWFGFLWLPAREVTRLGAWFAAKVAPVLAWVLQFLHPLLDRLIQFIRRHWPVTVHTGLYDKDDLLDLLEAQTAQTDNRIRPLELEIAMHALVFGDRFVRDVMVPRRVVKAIPVDEVVGPVLMSELHKSGFSRFPVYEGEAANIVGTLFLRDLVKAKAGGQIRKLMHTELLFLHEEQSLLDALQAILKTRRHMFIVVNSFEEYVGIITMEDILEQIVGRPIVDEFDQYDDLRAVAARSAAIDHKKHTAAEAAATKSTPEPET